MTEPPVLPPDDLPRAVADAPRRTRLPFVWILPALVIVVAGFVAVQQKLAQGPSIDIYFQGADGIEANKTKIRYKDVDIGDVTNIRVSKDRKKVVVTDSGWYGPDSRAATFQGWARSFPARTSASMSAAPAPSGATSTVWKCRPL
jgi:hypothetical protein